MNLDNLYKRINERGLTLKKVSQETGISSGLLSEWKNGNRMPSVVTLEKVADFLECSIDYLIGRSDIPYQISVPKEITLKLNNIFKEFIHLNDIFYLPGDKKNYCVRLKDYHYIDEIYDTAYKFNNNIMPKDEFEKLFQKFDGTLHKFLDSDCFAINIKEYYKFEEIYNYYVDYYFNLMIDKFKEDVC